MKKSHVLLAAWGVTIAIVLAMPQLRSLVRFSYHSLVAPNSEFGRMSMTAAEAETQEDKFVAAIHASKHSITSFSTSPDSNLSALHDYCVSFPNDIEAAGIYCRRAMRQPYIEPGKRKQTSKAWVERSRGEREQLLKVATTAEKQDPKNWVWRLAKAYVYLHAGDEKSVAEALTAQPLPTMYSDYANREAERLDTYYKGDFWSVTPVQTVATHASIVFPNYSAIMGLFDGKYRTVSQPEKIVGAQCAVDIASSAEFFIGSLVAKNIATRLVSTTPKPTRKLKPAELEALIAKADWLGLVPASEQPVFKKLVLTQPKFEFDDDLAVMMAATSAHVPLMMGLVAAALALLALIPWRPKLKYPYIAPIVIGVAGLPLSLMLDSHRVAIWAQNNSLSTMFVDFNTAQKFMSNLGYGTIGLAIIIAAYRLIANWKNQEVRIQTGIGLAVLLVSLAPTQLQFSLVLVGALLATLDSEKLIQPGVAVFICTAAIGLEYSFQPQGMQALLGVVPAVLAVAAAPRLRGATQLGWLSLALIFSGFLVQRITLPSMGTWYEKERDQLANYRKEIGVAVIR